jgi:hypothetical protein
LIHVVVCVVVAGLVWLLFFVFVDSCWLLLLLFSLFLLFFMVKAIWFGFDDCQSQDEAWMGRLQRIIAHLPPPNTMAVGRRASAAVLAAPDPSGAPDANNPANMLNSVIREHLLTVRLV